MIGKLTGSIDHIQQNTIILDVSGVGYKVMIPVKTLLKLSGTGEKIALFIHTHVREDTLSLYGFETREELRLFEQLLSVSGVGAKIAISVLSAGTVSEITQAVIDADVDFFNSISGIGKKSAQRIIVELKSAVGDKQDIDLTEANLPAFREATEALQQFGFRAHEIKASIKKVQGFRKLNSEALIKEALKLLGS